MVHPSLLAIISFGIIGVQSKVIRILEIDYNSSIVKTYESTAPNTIEFVMVNGTSSLVSNVDGKGYYFGPLDALGKILFIRPYIVKLRNNNYTDPFGNTLICEKGELEIKKTRKRYKIRIRPSDFIVDCFLDNYKRRVFLLCGITKNAKKGRVRVFDLKNLDIRGEDVLTEEIVHVGENITAVAVGQHDINKGVVVMIEEISDKNSFNILVLKAIITTFDDATEEAATKIRNRFNIVLQNRLNRFVNDNLKLRLNIEWQLKKGQNGEYSLNERVINKKSTQRIAELEQALDKMKKRMKLLYQRNIIRNDTKKYAVLGNRTRRFGIVLLPRFQPEVGLCRNRSAVTEAFDCAPETQFENRVKDYLISEKAFVEIQEWLNAGDDTKGISGVINILGQDYEVNAPRNHFKDTQSFIQFQSEIFELVGSKFETHPLAQHDPKIKTPLRKVPLSFGNELNCNSNGRATFVDKNSNPNRNYSVKTGNSSFIFQCYGDSKRNKVFILSGKRRNPSKGSLYVFDTTEVDIMHSRVITEEIKEAGETVSVVTVRESDGVIMLSLEITVSRKKAYKMIVLKPTSEMIAPSRKEPSPDLSTIAINNSSKLYSTYDAEETEFLHAIVEVENSLVSILKEKWKVLSEKLRKERQQMRTYGEILLTYYTSVNDSASLYNLRQSIESEALNDTRMKSTFDGDLIMYIKDTGNDLFKKYIDERTRTQSELNLIDLDVACRGQDEWYACVKKSEWRKREEFHERLQSYFDEIMENDSI